MVFKEVLLVKNPFDKEGANFNMCFMLLFKNCFLI